MKTALLLALAGCVVSSQQPSYYQSPPGQPQQPQRQPHPNAYAASAPPAASCKDTLQCYTQCNPFTQQCVTACDQRSTPDATQSAHAVLQCMSGCSDQNCVAQRCGPQSAPGERGTGVERARDALKRSRLPQIAAGSALAIANRFVQACAAEVEMSLVATIGVGVA